MVADGWCGSEANIKPLVSNLAHSRHRLVTAVQELAPGKSLAQMVADGWRGSEAEIKQLAQQLLDTLQYLGGRRPPVTHRCAAALDVWRFQRQVHAACGFITSVVLLLHCAQAGALPCYIASQMWVVGRSARAGSV